MQPVNRQQDSNRRGQREQDEHGASSLPCESMTTRPVVELPANTESSANDQICTEGAVPRAGSADNLKLQSTPSSRVRVGAAELGRAPCADRISGLEKIVQRFNQNVLWLLQETKCMVPQLTMMTVQLMSQGIA